jgi:hypothetical protein
MPEKGHRTCAECSGDCYLALCDVCGERVWFCWGCQVVTDMPLHGRHAHQ